jgi:hypothetical protein
MVWTIVSIASVTMSFMIASFSTLPMIVWISYHNRERTREMVLWYVSWNLQLNCFYTSGPTNTNFTNQSSFPIRYRNTVFHCHKPATVKWIMTCIVIARISLEYMSQKRWYFMRTSSRSYPHGSLLLSLDLNVE